LKRGMRMPHGMLRALNWFNIVSSISSFPSACWRAFCVSLSWKLKGLLCALFLAREASRFLCLRFASFLRKCW
jgi:hypothetical protein